MRQHTRTDAQHDRTRGDYRTRTIGAAPETDTTARTVGVCTAMTVAAVVVAMAASYPVAAAVATAVVAGAVAGAAIQRRYGDRTEERVGVTATSRG
ncbi:hypothetical protein [Haloparvum sp. PAK95]|uniref:hypothetical protein n=1 Tax=Haloparvum sp. PAK95 TaxID=3418962 RepID=UPI003D2F47F3